MSSAITIAAVGVGVSAYGAYSSSQAAGKAGRAQQDAAAAFQQQQQQQEQDAVSKIQSPSQMAAYTQSLQAQQQNVQRQQALVSQLDPNLIEAGRQAHDLMQGKSAPVLSNIQTQRDAQRQQLQSQLVQQMGPGGASSSAGQQALAKFDLDTSNMMNSVQQQYLDKMNNISIGGAATLGDSLNKVNQTLSTIQTQSPGEEAAKVMAQFNSGQVAAGQAQVASAGGQYAGQQTLGQGLVGVGSGITGLGGAVAGNNKATATTPGTTGH